MAAALCLARSGVLCSTFLNVGVAPVPGAVGGAEPPVLGVVGLFPVGGKGNGGAFPVAGGGKGIAGCCRVCWEPAAGLTRH